MRSLLAALLTTVPFIAQAAPAASAHIPVHQLIMDAHLGEAAILMAKLCAQRHDDACVSKQAEKLGALKAKVAADKDPAFADAKADPAIADAVAKFYAAASALLDAGIPSEAERSRQAMLDADFKAKQVALTAALNGGQPEGE